VRWGGTWSGVSNGPVSLLIKENSRQAAAAAAAGSSRALLSGWRCRQTC